MGNTAHDFIRELQALKDLHEFLVQFTELNIMGRLNEYHGAVQVLIDTGVPRQSCETYIQENFREDEAHYKQLLTHIIDIDFRYIRFYIEQICEQYQVATGSRIDPGSLSIPDITPRPSMPRNIIARDGGVADLVIQADALYDFSEFLWKILAELQQSLLRYEQYCNELLANGVPRQMYGEYVQQCASTDVQLIRQIITLIETKDLPYLSNVFKQIVFSIGALGGSYTQIITVP